MKGITKAAMPMPLVTQPGQPRLHNHHSCESDFIPPVKHAVSGRDSPPMHPRLRAQTSLVRSQIAEISAYGLAVLSGAHSLRPLVQPHSGLEPMI